MGSCMHILSEPETPVSLVRHRDSDVPPSSDKLKPLAQPLQQHQLCRVQSDLVMITAFVPNQIDAVTRCCCKRGRVMYWHASGCPQQIGCHTLTVLRASILIYRFDCTQRYSWMMLLQCMATHLEPDSISKLGREAQSRTRAAHDTAFF